MRSALTIAGLIIVSFSLSLAVVSSAGSGKRVIFDNSVGFFGLDNYEATGFTKLRNDLEVMGYTVTDSIEVKTKHGEITSDLLGKASIFVIINPIRTLSYSERQEIMEYVQRGGRLVLICDNPTAMENANDLARNFGVRFVGRYIASSELHFEGHSVKLYSLMPMKYDEESGESAEVVFKVNATARTWKSFWEIGGELPPEEYYLVLGVNYGRGKAMFLSDKDFLLNCNYDENSSALVKAVFSWLESNKPFKPEKPSVSLSVKKLVFNNYSGTSYLRFFISNPTSLNETVNITSSKTLSLAVHLNRQSFKLTPSSKIDVLAIAHCPQGVSYIFDYLNITASAQNISTSHLLPVEVRCYAE